jgi:hypothetical protein
VDFKWIKGVNCLSYQAWEGWLCLWWFWAQKLEHTNRGRRELLACRRRAPGGAFYRAGRPAWVDRPGWLRAPLWLGFLPARSSPLCDLCACVLHLLHRLNALVHSFACIIGPSTWCSCFESCPCSLAPLASHATINFLQIHACCPPMIVLCMWSYESCWKGIQWCIMVHAWLT